MRPTRLHSVPRGRLAALALVLALAAAAAGIASAAGGPDKTEEGVRAALTAFSDACAVRDLDRVMAMFDDGPGVMVIGSNHGEICKGRDQIRSWIGGLFRARAFAWEMDRVDVDANGATAWAFVEGRMVVSDTTGAVLGKPPYRICAVFVHKGDAWKWRVFDGAIIGGE